LEKSNGEKDHYTIGYKICGQRDAAVDPHFRTEKMYLQSCFLQVVSVVSAFNSPLHFSLLSFSDPPYLRVKK
jgi:hypothetical protein